MSIHFLQIIDEILFQISQDESIDTKDDFQKLQNRIYRGKNITAPIPNIAFIERYKDLLSQGILSYNSRVWKLLRRRAVRSLSGIAVISFLTKSFGCPGKCTYCPTYEGLPKSYVSDEPAVMRAQMNDFQVYRQITNRLRALEITGHVIDKCDIRTIGGTWSFYPKDYQEEVIRNMYDAHTTYPEFRRNIVQNFLEQGKFAPLVLATDFIPKLSLSVEEAKKRNEGADCRVIGLAIETRPDWIDIEEIGRLRYYGVTRVEIGYQTTFDEINQLTRRGHGNLESIRATQLLKDAGFKVVAHMMPNLPGSNPDMDKQSLRRVFEDSDFRPDELKIYPCMVTPHSQLEKTWRDGQYEPYSDEILIDLMADLQAILPEYVRLNRMYRDIPASEILAGSTLANLRQHTEDRMHEKGFLGRDISEREIRDKGNDPHNAVIDVAQYEASGGIEYFLQYIDPVDRTLFGLCRLRIRSKETEEQIIQKFPELEGAALIRELHVFGDHLPIGVPGDGTGQHMGFGKRMLEAAENIIRENHPDIRKIAIIAGVGSRPYYELRGYSLEGEYMTKSLSIHH